MKTINKFMQLALKEASKAAKIEEIPIGAVITHNNSVIAAAHNMNRTLNNATRHAEIIAIEEASKVLQNERLLDCDLYVTKEPCAMCAGAIIHSRIRHVYIGSPDIKYGACGTVFDVCGNSGFNHVPQISFNILEEECTKLIKDFFKKLRQK